MTSVGPVDQDRLQVVDEVDGAHPRDAQAALAPPAGPDPPVRARVPGGEAEARGALAAAGGKGRASTFSVARAGLAARGTTMANAAAATAGSVATEPAATRRAAGALDRVRHRRARAGGAVGDDHEGEGAGQVADTPGEPVDLRAQQRRVAEQPEARARAPPVAPARPALLPGPQGPGQHGHEPRAGGDAQHDLGGGGHRGGVRPDDGPGGVEPRHQRPPRRGGGEAVRGWPTGAGPTPWRGPPDHDPGHHDPHGRTRSRRATDAPRCPATTVAMMGPTTCAAPGAWVEARRAQPRRQRHGQEPEVRGERRGPGRRGAVEGVASRHEDRLGLAADASRAASRSAAPAARGDEDDVVTEARSPVAHTAPPVGRLPHRRTTAGGALAAPSRARARSMVWRPAASGAITTRSPVLVHSSTVRPRLEGARRRTPRRARWSSRSSRRCGPTGRRSTSSASDPAWGSRNSRTTSSPERAREGQCRRVSRSPGA